MDLDASKGKLKATEAPWRTIILTEAPCSVVLNKTRSTFREISSVETKNRFEKQNGNSFVRVTRDRETFQGKSHPAHSLDSENFTRVERREST